MLLRFKKVVYFHNSYMCRVTTNAADKVQKGFGFFSSWDWDNEGGDVKIDFPPPSQTDKTQRSTSPIPIVYNVPESLLSLSRQGLTWPWLAELGSTEMIWCRVFATLNLNKTIRAFKLFSCPVNFKIFIS